MSEIMMLLILILVFAIFIEVVVFVIRMVLKSKKTDGGIDAKAMGDKFAEQLKPIGDLVISVGMIVCVAVSIIFGMKFVAASRKRSRNRKIKNAIFWICNCIFCVCFSISNMEFYSKNYFRNGSKSLRNSFKLFYLNLI